MAKELQEQSGNVIKFKRRMLQLEQPDEASMDNYASPAVAMAEAMTISGDEDYDFASTTLGEVKQSAANLNKQRKEITAPLDAVKKSIMDLYRTPISGLKRAESIIKGKMMAYYRAQQEKAAEEQRRLREIARKESERLAKAAARAAAKDQQDKADALIQQAESVPVPVVAAPPPAAAGVSYRETWQFRITDANAIPREYLVVDEKLIRRVVQAMKGNTNIPGVEAYAETVIAKKG